MGTVVALVRRCTSSWRERSYCILFVPGSSHDVLVCSWCIDKMVLSVQQRHYSVAFCSAELGDCWWLTCFLVPCLDVLGNLVLLVTSNQIVASNQCHRLQRLAMTSSQMVNDVRSKKFVAILARASFVREYP